MSAETDLVGRMPAASSEPAVNSPIAITTPEGCPNPLGLAQVLEAFRAQNTPWTVRADGASFCGRTLGNGRPLYFLNGLSGTSDLYCLMVWVLKDDFRCVVFDYPTDVKQSRRIVGPKTLAAGLFAAADLHGDTSFSLFATSFGSLVALDAMIERPGQIERAILQAGSAHRNLSAAERLMCRLGRFAPGKLASLPFLDTFQRANHQRYFPPFDASRWGFFAENVGNTAIRDVANRAAIVAACDYRPRLAEIRQPVLLIRSEHEGLVSAACVEELQSGLPKATTEMLHSTGPLAHLAHPHRLAKLTRAFFEDARQPAAVDGSICLSEAR